MLFIWRGLGILVPIIIFLSGLLMSVWFEDTRLGNYPFIGWSLFWAGIVISILGAMLFGGGGAVNPNTGEIGKGKSHDFFWIPMLFWGIGLTGLGIWLMNKEPLDGFGTETTVVTNEVFKETDNSNVERLLNVYNPSDDSIYVDVIDAKTKESVFDFYVPAWSTRYKAFGCKKYIIEIDGDPMEIEMKPMMYKKKDDYDQLWIVAKANQDLLLVDVTDACGGDVTRGDIRDIDWTEKVIKRYNGRNLIEPKLISSPKKKRIIYSLGDKLPIDHEANEYIYTLLTVGKARSPINEDLADQIIGLCFND